MLLLSTGESNTGLEFWMSEPVMHLAGWLRLLREQYKAQADAMKKR